MKKRAGEEDIDLDIEETVPNIVTPASGSSTPIVLSTSPHQSNKRSRNRSNKGSQNKDAKLFRKVNILNIIKTKLFAYVMYVFNMYLLVIEHSGEYSSAN